MFRSEQKYLLGKIIVVAVTPKFHPEKGSLPKVKVVTPKFPFKRILRFGH